MLAAFATLFVVANVLPIVPVVLSLVEDVDVQARRAFLLAALLTGNVVALAAALGGSAMLRGMGVALGDLRIAGGLILLVFAIHDLLFSREQRMQPQADAAGHDASRALVPLAVPVLVGPATLATVVVLAESAGRIDTAVAIAGNVVVNGGILLVAERLYRLLGRGVGRAVGKVMGLVLAAIAISMLRAGIAEAINGTGGG